MKYKTVVQVTESGKILRLFHENGRLVAEILVHGPLNRVLQNCEDELPIISGRPNVFRGELFGLAGYEYLNCDTEVIEER